MTAPAGTFLPYRFEPKEIEIDPGFHRATQTDARYLRQLPPEEPTMTECPRSFTADETAELWRRAKSLRAELATAASDRDAFASERDAARTAHEEALTRIVAMIALARETEDPGALAVLEREADAILAATLDAMASQQIDDSGLSAYRLAMDQLSRAVSERRRYLAGETDGLRSLPPGADRAS
jgi:hypothetical protein